MGSIIYESANDQMQYCDGENWVPMGPPGDGGGGCSSPAGTAGDLVYNSTYNIMQYCEGDEYIAIGQGLDPCDPSQSPADGQLCRDGSLYAGLSPDGNVPMFVTPADAPGGAIYTWNNGNSTGRVLTGIGTFDPEGEDNTNLLVSLDSDSITAGTQPHVAAQYCYDLVAHGKTDWYLPSRAELDGLIDDYATYGFALNTSYWTSSERTQDNADILRNAGSGFLTGQLSKNFTVSVRCARKD